MFILGHEWQGAAEHPVWEEAMKCPVQLQPALTWMKTQPTTCQNFNLSEEHMVLLVGHV